MSIAQNKAHALYRTRRGPYDFGKKTARLGVHLVHHFGLFPNRFHMNQLEKLIY
jgi:hypothetical protein